MTSTKEVIRDMCLSMANLNHGLIKEKYPSAQMLNPWGSVPIKYPTTVGIRKPEFGHLCVAVLVHKVHSCVIFNEEEQHEIYFSDPQFYNILYNNIDRYIRESKTFLFDWCTSNDLYSFRLVKLNG